MCNDLLPESVNNFLDDVETTTCLPILIIIVICTVQFILNHVFDIVYIICQAIQDKSDNGGNEDGDTIICKLKGVLSKLVSGKSEKVPGPESNGRRNNGRDTYPGKEWDYSD